MSPAIGEFDWNEQAQGVILGSFFWGYACTNLLGGVLAERVGGRLVYGAGVSLTAVLTILSPFTAKHSTSAFVIIRILEGMMEVISTCFTATAVLNSNFTLSFLK